MVQRQASGCGQVHPFLCMLRKMTAGASRRCSADCAAADRCSPFWPDRGSTMLASRAQICAMPACSCCRCTTAAAAARGEGGAEAGRSFRRLSIWRPDLQHVARAPHQLVSLAKECPDHGWCRNLRNWALDHWRRHDQRNSSVLTAVHRHSGSRQSMQTNLQSGICAANAPNVKVRRHVAGPFRIPNQMPIEDLPSLIGLQTDPQSNGSDAGLPNLKQSFCMQTALLHHTQYAASCRQRHLHGTQLVDTLIKPRRHQLKSLRQRRRPVDNSYQLPSHGRQCLPRPVPPPPAVSGTRGALATLAELSPATV